MSRGRIGWPTLALGPVSNYPQLAYSMHDVRRAGDRLAENVLWSEPQRDEILKTFAIAHSWRDSHIYPMRSVRMSVLQKMRHAGIKGVTAARPKRMTSIRRKLAAQTSMKLDQINDLAGCRAIVEDIASVRRLVAECDGLRHSQRKPYDYIERPKADGYRSVHLVFNFDGGKEAQAFTGRRVELQIRTRLQHSWATAVEAVGMFRGEDMKAGEGSPDWLRLFQLMSAEFAVAENCPVLLPGSREERIEEIRELDQRLRAIGVLEDLKNVTQFFDEHVQINETAAHYYLIMYNHEDHSVKVHPYQDPLLSAATYSAAERKIESGESYAKVVLVELDQIENLVEAYPNYFGDVTLFVSNLKQICAGREAVEYTLSPQALAPKKPAVKPDMSWLSHPRWRKWTEKKSSRQLR